MLICVTDRRLCPDDFLQRVAQIAKGKPEAILLREKDLQAAAYENLAGKVQEICRVNQVLLIIHQNMETARKLGIPFIHLSLPALRQQHEDLQSFSGIGVSVHSVDEAIEAEALGATYLIAGHIFPTDCKKGVPARGLPFLKEVCAAVAVPVLAIGGVTRDKAEAILEAGAKGFCIMSEAMTCPRPAELAGSFRF
jgi:thiamine-phosphate pyrophosphorylase